MSLEVEYDVAIVGGGPIGLSSAYELAVQRGKKVIVLESSTIHNANGSSPGFGRQWRVPYAEKWLCQLAIQGSQAWDDVMNQTGHFNLVDRTGVLWFGDPTVTTPEGQINKAIESMKALKQEYTKLDADDLKLRFPWLTSGLEKEDKTVGLFAPDGGTINIKATLDAFLHALYASGRAIIEENSPVTKIHSTCDGVTLTANGKEIKAKKVILAPGVYINNVLDSFEPKYPKRINLTVYLWMSTYFKVDVPESEITKIPNRLPRPSTDGWPVWIYFGHPEEQPDKNVPANGNSYYGFPSDVQDAPFDVRIAPGFTSLPKFTFTYPKMPPAPEERGLDEGAIKFNKEFIEKWMKGWVDADNMDPRKTSTCVAGFAEAVQGDDSQGFVLDILPDTHNNVVVCTGGWAMKFVPLFGRIASDLALNGEAPEYEIHNMRWDRGIAVDPQECKDCEPEEHIFRFLRQARYCH